MKAFKDLKIGDIVYKVDQGYRCVDGPQIQEVKVHTINLDKDMFQVNKYYGYSSYSYLLNIKIEEADTNILRKEDEFLTTDIDLVKLGMKETGMKLIKQYENDIENCKKKIEKTRSLYFEYLNYTK